MANSVLTTVGFAAYSRGIESGRIMRCAAESYPQRGK